MQELTSTLIDNGYARVWFFPKPTRISTSTFPPRNGIDGYGNSLPGTLPRAIATGFKKFLNEDDSYKSQWEFDLEGRGDSDDGYIRRQGKGHDYKSFFHYRPHLWHYLWHSGVDFSEHENFLLFCGSLYDEALKKVCECAETVDRDFPGINLVDGIRRNRQHVLRLLHYDLPEAGKSGEVLAKRHADRSLFTLHIAESYPGLEIGGEVVPSYANQALFFPGSKADVETNGKVKALVHGAIDPQGLEVERPANRWVIVFFAHI